MAHAEDNAASDPPELVDWDLATATAAWLIRPGPRVTPDVAAEVVAELRSSAAAARGHVERLTGLSAPGDTPVLVVDRAAWTRANVAGFRTLVAPLAAKQADLNIGRIGSAVGPRLAGIEAGSLLAYLSHRVLGQFDPFGDEPRGRLLLVAPNVVAVERELDVPPHDFRLWVCLHEETHRTQFTAVSWLRDHLLSEIGAFISQAELEPTALAARLRSVAGGMRSGARASESESGPTDRVAEDDSGDTANGSRSLLEMVQTPEQRRILDRIVAVMSLLEGHADYVMDGVGPEVVPSVAEIRRRFGQRRRRGAGRVDTVLRRLLGLDAKLRQYQDGERFVRYVVEHCEMVGFNRVWTSPNTLPTRAEIADPALWVRRVHGGGAAAD